MSDKSASELKASIRKICSQVESENRKRKYDQLQKFLAKERDEVLKQTEERPSLPIKPLPSTDRIDSPDGEIVRVEGEKVFKITQKIYREARRTTSSVRSEILPRVSPLPRHLIYTPIQYNHRVSDHEKLTFVPYLGEDREYQSDVLSNHDVSYRVGLLVAGPQCTKDEKNELIDRVLYLCSQLQYQDQAVWEHQWATSIVLSTLSETMKTGFDRIQERYQKFISNGSEPAVDAAPEATADKPMHDDMELGDDGAQETSCDEIDKQYLEALDSYRALYCRRCCTFNCNLHGLSNKPSLNFQYDRASQKADDGVWSSLGKGSSASDGDRFLEVKDLSSFHKMICKRMFLIYEGSVEEMSNAMRAPKHLILDFIASQEFKLPSNPTVKQIAKSRSPFHYSVKHYRHKWYRAIEKAEIHPLFVPCVHEGPCSDETCSCVKNRYFCTSACCWGPSSPNFFRGCGCKSACNAKSCTCFATKRECDPDICGCGTCCDPPNRPATIQICRNDNVRMRRHAHLLLGPSQVAGWGLYNKYAIRKGDFIHEYLGEVVSQQEAERRGQISDLKDSSYLVSLSLLSLEIPTLLLFSNTPRNFFKFNLSSDYAIDAYRKGSKARFINHSESPNCDSKTLFVNGDQRIAFFASKDIPAETELFFNYRYNVAIDNDLIKKPAKSFDWMKKEGAKNLDADKNSKKR
jgi:hypothetical protein